MFRGISDQMKDNLKMPAILIAIFRIRSETLKLQWTTFNKNGTATGKTADVMRALYDVIAQLSTPTPEWE